MNYNKIVQGILDIGEAMLQSGAENFRLEDSFYRMCRSYGFKRSDVFVIPSNIQVTVETPEGEIITQIRHIESSEPNFDQLDYLNNLMKADLSGIRTYSNIEWPEELEKEGDYMLGFADSLLRQARAESEARGKAEGKTEEMQANIRSMQKNGLSAETIAQYLNKSIDVVRSFML